MDQTGAPERDDSMVYFEREINGWQKSRDSVYWHARQCS